MVHRSLSLSVYVYMCPCGCICIAKQAHLSVQTVIKGASSGASQTRNNQTLIWGVCLLVRGCTHANICVDIQLEFILRQSPISSFPNSQIVSFLHPTHYKRSLHEHVPSHHHSLIHPHPVRPYRSSLLSPLFHSDFLSSANTELCQNSQVVQVHYFGR